MSGKICTLHDFCRMTGDDPLDVIEFLLDNEAARLTADRAALDARSTAGHEQARPLEDGNGYEFARCVARIPVNSFYHFMQRKDFGREGVMSQEGIREIVKDNPAWGVDAVSGRTTVGWEPAEKQKAESGKRKVNLNGANFNGLNLAN